ncbi:MAG: YitT family protein [Firmicutes bacterium]|nr:YitT family protein [Bacillota bacterium]
MTTLDKNKKIRSTIIIYIIVFLASAIAGISVFIFILPNRFAPGGLTGIAAAIYYINPAINPGWLVLGMNIPLLILAFFKLNRGYVYKSIVAIATSSVVLIILNEFVASPNYYYGPNWLYNIRYTTEQSILPAIAGGVFRGLGMGILIKMGASNGGSEIVGGLVNKKWPHLNAARIILAVDVTVVLSTAFIVSGSIDGINPIDIVILSIINMVTSTIVCNTILQGFNSAMKFEIITMQEEQLSKDLVMELGRSVTKIKARGGYTGQEKTILICIIKNKQIAAFNRILKKYPDTFAYMVGTKEVYGRGFSIPHVKEENFGTAIEGEGNIRDELQINDEVVSENE